MEVCSPLGSRGPASGDGSLERSNRPNNLPLFRNGAFVVSITWWVLILLFGTRQFNVLVPLFSFCGRHSGWFFDESCTVSVWMWAIRLAMCVCVLHSCVPLHVRNNVKVVWFDYLIVNMSVTSIFGHGVEKRNWSPRAQNRNACTHKKSYLYKTQFDSHNF